MTTNTPAQHEAAIQEGERVAAADEYFAARTWIMDTNDNRRIFEAGFDRAYALLSKLRAPVADERAAQDQTLAAHTDLLTYVLQGDVHNRMTPRVIDIAYTAFMCAKRPNAEDGGPSDWFTDTKPVVVRAIAKLRKDLMEARAALASAPVAAQEFKAAFPNGALSAAKYHELWERAGKGVNTTYTLLENMSWCIARFGELVAEEVAASVLVAGEAQPVAWFRKTDITEWTDTEPETEGWTPLYEHAAPRASEAVGIEEAFAGLDRILAVRDAALEDAAAVVEARVGVGEPGIDTHELDRETQECANAIRALKSQSTALSTQPGAQPKDGSHEN